MVAQDAHGTIPETLDEAQCCEGVGTAVDQIADEPQAIALRVERDMFEQALERREAALDIADRVGRHERDGSVVGSTAGRRSASAWCLAVARTCAISTGWPCSPRQRARRHPTARRYLP